MKRYRRLAGPLLKDERVLQMKKYTQHGGVDTFRHAERVARMSYRIDRRLHAHCDRKALIRGALLHDYYLYDWHQCHEKWHGFRHPKLAANNADRDFELTKRERDIIRTHMWPLTITKMPPSKEAWIVCLADKICSLEEVFTRKHKR